jgi:hypothetical protein
MEPAPRFFTTATPLGVYQMDLGASSTLQLPNDAPAPDVRGDAVLVIEVASLAPQRFKQWELRAAEVGQTVISIDVDGRPISWTLVVTA